MSNGGFRSESLSSGAEITIEILPLETHKERNDSYYLFRQSY